MRLLIAGLLCFGVLGALNADEPKVASRQRVLLIGQGPDGHPPTTHEYRAGTQVLAKLLAKQSAVQSIVISADGEWADGPMLLDGADAVVLFVSQGAKWVQSQPQRLDAFRALAQRGGGLVVLHWGMGTKDAADIGAFVELFGGCHGGPDRRYKVLETRLEPTRAAHPILHGVEALTVKEEFYYQLKWPKPAPNHSALLQVSIDGETWPVAWSWERPAGGRSFGFSGLHFHANWKHESYRRVVLQAVLWTLGRAIPDQGADVSIAIDDLKLD